MKSQRLIPWFITKFFPCLICAEALIAAPFGYVTNPVDDTFSIIDTATNMVVGTIPVPSSPSGVAVTPDGLKVYISDLEANSISVFDAATGSAIGHPITVGHYPTGIAFTPDGSKAYVCNALSNTVSVIDVLKNVTVGDPIHVGQTPVPIAITPDGSKAYVGNVTDANISVIDIATGEVAPFPIPLYSRATSIAFAPDGSKAYVCTSGQPHNTQHIYIIHTATNAVIGTIPFPNSSPRYVVFTPDGTKAYVSIHGSGFRDSNGDAQSTVRVIDVTTDQIMGDPIPVGSNLGGIAITPDGSTVYVCDFKSSSVYVIDTVTNEVVGNPIPIPVGDSSGPTSVPTAIHTLLGNATAGSIRFFLIAIGPNVTPAAPRKFIGTIERHDDSHWRKTSLLMKWKESTSSHIDRYEIFASGKLIASIPASAHHLKFQKRLQPYVRDGRLPKSYLHFLHDKYRIRAVNTFGTASPLKKLKITDPNCTKNDFTVLEDQANQD
jgi:YVTN family beta-propeller protein